MRRHRIRLTLGAAAATLAVAAVASPVAAAAPDQFRWSDQYVVQHDCGVVESTTVFAHEKVWFEDGTWVRTTVHFTFVGVFTGPTGKTYTSTSRQLATLTPETVSLNGQGTFLRGPGGVLVMDAGHLVLERGTGGTIQASARVIRADDPEAGAAVDAALCAKLG